MPCTLQRADHPMGRTCTASQVPHRWQYRGGSVAPRHPGHSVAGRPQPAQWEPASSATPAVATVLR